MRFRFRRLRVRRLVLATAFFSLAGFLPSVSMAQIIDLELITGGSASLTEQQKWHESLQKVKSIRFRLRQGGPRDEAKVENLGTEARPRYRVTGLVDARGKMIVPGGRFDKTETKKLEAWVQRLLDEGEDGVVSPRGAFGLTSKQLETAHKATQAIVRAETKGLPTHEVVATLQRRIRDIPFSIDRDAEKKLAAKQPVLDELKGLSIGTALSTLLRPLGLSMTLRAEKGKVQFVIIDPKKHEGEVWPIGWATKGAKSTAAPKLFNYLTVEIDEGTSLATIIESIAGRVEVPVLFDHNAMARDGVELEKLTARFPYKRTYYLRILESTMGQGGLKPFLRMDEANKPFLWVTTTKPQDRPQ
jgi:hypothetical protein